MSIFQFGSTSIAKIKNSHDLTQLLIDPWLKTETIIIKPNWVGTDIACYTDSQTLRMLFEALDSKFIVVESYQIGRSMHDPQDGLSFMMDGEELNWRSLLQGKGWSKLQKGMDWEWFKNDVHWDHIKSEEQWFLDEYGFTDLFKEFGVEYINVTEEVWQGRIVNPNKIKTLVESKFNPICIDQLYKYFPQKLYNLKGSTLISLAKIKHYATFSMKNLFGMIPDPVRAWYHGPKNQRFASAILDITKIYASLFNVYGICEALKTRAIKASEGEHGVSTFRYNVAKNLGIVAYGRHLVSLDAILCGILGFDFKDAPYLQLAEKDFGSYDNAHIEEAINKVNNWFF